MKTKIKKMKSFPVNITKVFSYEVRRKNSLVARFTTNSRICGKYIVFDKIKIPIKYYTIDHDTEFTMRYFLDISKLTKSQLKEIQSRLDFNFKI